MIRTYMNETFLTSKAFAGQPPERLLKASMIERELIEDTCLTVTELYDRIDRAAGLDTQQILKHHAIMRGLEADK